MVRSSERQKTPPETLNDSETARIDKAMMFILLSMFEDLELGRPQSICSMHAENQAEALLRLVDRFDRPAAQKALRAHVRALLSQLGPDD